MIEINLSEISVEQIMQKLEEELANRRTKRPKKPSPERRTTLQTSGSSPSEGHISRLLKIRIIAYALKFKYIIKKIPILNLVSKKMYHYLLYGNTKK